MHSTFYMQNRPLAFIDRASRALFKQQVCAHAVRTRRKDLEPFDSKSLIHVVRLAGIEPTTPWFVAKYSIQLSYSRSF